MCFFLLQIFVFLSFFFLQDDLRVVFSKKKTDIPTELSEMCWKVHNCKFSAKREEGYGEVVQELSIVSEGRCFVRLEFSVY